MDRMSGRPTETRICRMKAQKSAAAAMRMRKPGPILWRQASMMGSGDEVLSRAWLKDVDDDGTGGEDEGGKSGARARLTRRVAAFESGNGPRRA